MRIVMCIFLACILVSGCREDASSGEQSDRSAAVADLPWTFLTDGILHQAMTFSGSKVDPNNPAQGNWIDFHPDGTYAYGKYSATRYTGKYTFDPDKTVLLLLPDNNAAPPSEWTIKWNDDDVVFLGTSTYQNNSTQIKWERRAGLPVR